MQGETRFYLSIAVAASRWREPRSSRQRSSESMRIVPDLTSDTSERIPEHLEREFHFSKWSRDLHALH